MRAPVPGLPIEQQPDDILLAMLVWGEARSADATARAGVAWAAKNRCLKHDKPIRQVILEPWQFSCFLDPPDGERDKLLNAPAVDGQEVWDECGAIAQGVISGSIPDPTGGATHYVVAHLWATDDAFRRIPRWFSAQCIKAGITTETARLGPHVFAETA